MTIPPVKLRSQLWKHRCELSGEYHAWLHGGDRRALVSCSARSSPTVAKSNLLQERYTEYLKTAENMEDIISIERELNNVISEIESMERTIRRLDGQISYSTVYFYGELPPEEQVSGELPSIVEGLKKLVYGFITLIYYIGLGLLYAVIFGVPIILVLGLIYLVGWGRIGLVRKFFKLLSRKKTGNRKSDG